uniref:Retrovirus-related Pol polyprotein from transposon TNT 1-94 n=1 Tax=Tanacetum cinerariifolium TaxID=118510 RepID=A0A6L2MTC4_TANCI|nr:retrovirus-related Pol polyprotein from transposon TNT 1-94 [Tanacetum cinerariifolium]
MLARGSYVQWRCRIMRYIDLKPNHKLIKQCIFDGPYKFKQITVPATYADGEHVAQEGRVVEETYETFTSREVETLESYYSRCSMMMNQMVRNKLKADTIQVKVQLLLELQLEWLRVVTIVKQAIDLDTISYHKLFEILKQHHNKVNELRAERIAKTANSLALVSTTHGKHFNILKHKKLTINKHHYHHLHQDKQHNPEHMLLPEAKECRLAMQVKDSAYHKEKILLCKKDKAGGNNDTWTDLVHAHEGPSDIKENKITNLKLGLHEKWLRFSQWLRNANHIQTLDLADIYEKFVYEDNLIYRRYLESKKAMITTPISSALFSNNVVHNFKESSSDEKDERSREEYLRDLDLEFHERALLASTWKTFEGNTRNLGSILEETRQEYDFTPKEGLKNKSHTVETKLEIFVTPSGSASVCVWKSCNSV